MATVYIMRRSSSFSERRVCVASDGYAYTRTRGGKVARYAHDGGIQTDDSTRVVLSREEVGEELWNEIHEAL